MLTVADILGIERLALRLAGGGTGATRAVRGAHTTELDDPTPWLSGGELLLTTGQPLPRELGAIAGSALCLLDGRGRVVAQTAEIDVRDPGVVRGDVVTGARLEAQLLALPGERCDRHLLHHIQTVLAVELLRRRSVAE